MQAAEELNGSCLCGAVRYRVRGPWKRLHHCHCSRCRKASGGAHSTTLFVAAHQLEWTMGAEGVKRYELPDLGWATTVCSVCGTPLPRLIDGGTTWGIPAGSLDQHPDIQPEARIFWASRAPWSCSAGDVPTFDEY